MQYSFKAKLWVWPGEKAHWRGVTVPKAIAEKIKKLVKVKRGFGSVRVQVTVGRSRWETSVFPDSQAGTYLLFIKAPVRRAEGIDDGDLVSVSIKTL
jgi:hypothetical protein